MSRFFIDISYYGKRYSGFQIQANANSIQAEVEKAFTIYFRQSFSMTGSSRTDAGVHALQNFFHFDYEGEVPEDAQYHINAILPPDIVLKKIYPVSPSAHCRYDAQSRDYEYHIYWKKDPFLLNRAHYFPYKMDFEKLTAVASCLSRYSDFSSFSKRNSQVKNFDCMIYLSEWRMEEKSWVFHIQANRFLRGMVRGLVGTMLQVGRNIISPSQFEMIIQSKDSKQTNFSVPGHGLFLVKVNYPEPVFSF
jgi:tRNA pseudouridine38-40 synthase